MAISKDRLVIEGDAADALREYAKLVDANKSLKNEMKELRKEAKETHSEQSSGVSKVGKELLTMAMGYASVGAAIGLVRSGLADSDQVMIIEPARGYRQPAPGSADAERGGARTAS